VPRPGAGGAAAAAARPQQQSGAEGDSDDADEGGACGGVWHCAQCTFANPDMCAGRCEVCDTRRPPQ
jgi:hypothetical protein